MKLTMLVLGASAAAASLLGLVAAVPAVANAAPLLAAHQSIRPAAAVPAVGAVQCDGNLCIQRTSASGANPATVRAWARTTTFTGHFELLFPDGVQKNSPNRSWTGGGSGFSFTGLPLAPGREHHRVERQVQFYEQRSSGLHLVTFLQHAASLQLDQSPAAG